MLEVFDSVLHRVSVGDAVQQDQHLDQGTEAVLRCRTPGDAGMGRSDIMQFSP